MNKVAMAISAVFFTLILSSSLYAEKYSSVVDIKKGGSGAIGKTISLKLKPRSIIVRNGVFTLADAGGSTITLRVPDSMAKRVARMNTGSFYKISFKVESVKPDEVLGIIMTISD